MYGLTKYKKCVHLVFFILILNHMAQVLFDSYIGRSQAYMGSELEGALVAKWTRESGAGGQEAGAKTKGLSDPW